MTANDGMARPMLTTHTATTPPRRRCPSTTAKGTAATIATSAAVSDSWTWAQNSSGRPLRPDQAASERRYSSMSDQASPMAGPSRPGPRRDHPLEQHEDQVEHHGEQHRQDGAHRDRRGEAAVQAVVDEAAEP